MSAHINVSDAQVWAENTKLPITSIDASLEQQVSTEVLGRLTQTYGAYVPGWVDVTTTPEIVKQVIAMYYVGWLYDRSYSEVVTNESQVSYGATLRNWASMLLADIIRGAVSIVEISPNQPAVAPTFYPNDVSSTKEAQLANWCDTSLGPEKFSMGKRF